ncbi:hypothetical protein PFISCL1PPCAC_1082, partial [Pristionchus fissidentatus]
PFLYFCTIYFESIQVSSDIHSVAPPFGMQRRLTLPPSVTRPLMYPSQHVLKRKIHSASPHSSKRRNGPTQLPSHSRTEMIRIPHIPHVSEHAPSKSVHGSQPADERAIEAMSTSKRRR